MKREKVELDWLHRHGVYVQHQASERTGAKPIRLLWIDTNKGDDVKEIEVVWWLVRSVTREKMDEHCNVLHVHCDASF